MDPICSLIVYMLSCLTLSVGVRVIWFGQLTSRCHPLCVCLTSKFVIILIRHCLGSVMWLSSLIYIVYSIYMCIWVSMMVASHPLKYEVAFYNWCCLYQDWLYFNGWSCMHVMIQKYVFGCSVQLVSKSKDNNTFYLREGWFCLML